MLDIFNFNRVEELEEELHRRNREYLKVLEERDDLLRDRDYLRAELKRVLELKDAIPEDCTPGSYCQACEFAKKFGYFHASPLGTGWLEGHICNKAQSCPNFIQKDTSRN